MYSSRRSAWASKVEHGQVRVEGFQGAYGAYGHGVVAAQHSHQSAVGRGCAHRLLDAADHRLRAADVRLQLGRGVDANWRKVAVELDVVVLELSRSVDYRGGAVTRSRPVGGRAVVGDGEEDHPRIGGRNFPRRHVEEGVPVPGDPAQGVAGISHRRLRGLHLGRRAP